MRRGGANLAPLRLTRSGQVARHHKGKQGGFSSSGAGADQQATMFAEGGVDLVGELRYRQATGPDGGIKPLPPAPLEGREAGFVGHSGRDLAPHHRVG